jgi:hypothetical protein
VALPNFSEYVVPGTYWEATPSPVAPQSLYTVNQVALVGPGIGYRTFAENITFDDTTPVSLTQLGINTDTVVVTSLDGTVVGVADTDYTLATTDSTDGHDQDTHTTIVWHTAGAFTDTETVRVSYQYTDYDYLTPSICTNLAQVQSLYGNGIDITTGEITSPISLAAQFAFTNGAQTLVLVATPNATVLRADLTDAYAFLEVLTNVNLVVPLFVGGAYADSINVGQDLATFLLEDENTNDLLRMGLIGFEVGTDTNEGYDPATIADSIAYKRVVEAWPFAMNYYNGYTNSTLVVGGYYLAAAYAGIFAGNQPQQGLTRQTIKNFTGIPSAVFQTMTTALKNQYGASGVAVAEISRAGVLWCRHGTTTDPSSIYNQEASLVREQDAMVTLLEGAVEQSGLIGTPIDDNTIVNLQALTIGILEQCVQLGIIYGYQAVLAQQLQSLPTTIQITFQWQPSYPLNYVTFIFSVNTTTGAVSAGTATGQTS